MSNQNNQQPMYEPQSPVYRHPGQSFCTHPLQNAGNPMDDSSENSKNAVGKGPISVNLPYLFCLIFMVILAIASLVLNNVLGSFISLVASVACIVLGILGFRKRMSRAIAFVCLIGGTLCTVLTVLNFILSMG